MTRLKRPKNKEWEKITAEELFDLAFRKNMIDVEIAEMYGVTKEQVSYKRNKFNLKRVYASVAMRRRLFESGIEALAVACDISEEYRHKYADLTNEYFQKLMGNK